MGWLYSHSTDRGSVDKASLDGPSASRLRVATKDDGQMMERHHVDQTPRNLSPVPGLT